MHKPKASLLKIYYFVFGFYAISPVFLILFLLDIFTAKESNMLFWVISLVSLLPCCLIGFVLSVIGLRISLKRKVRININVGIVATVLGAIGLSVGVLGWLLFYVVVGA